MDYQGIHHPGNKRHRHARDFKRRWGRAWAVAHHRRHSSSAKIELGLLRAYSLTSSPTSQQVKRSPNTAKVRITHGNTPFISGLFYVVTRKENYLLYLVEKHPHPQFPRAKSTSSAYIPTKSLLTLSSASRCARTTTPSRARESTLARYDSRLPPLPLLRYTGESDRWIMMTTWMAWMLG